MVVTVTRMCDGHKWVRPGMLTSCTELMFYIRKFIPQNTDSIPL